MNVKQPNRFFSKTITLTRPNDTTAYAGGDALATSTTAPTPLTITNLQPTSDGPIILRHAHIAKSGSSVTGAAFGLNFYSGTSNTAWNDNTTVLPTDYAKFIGRVSFNSMTTGAIASVSSGLIIESSSITIVPQLISAYTPEANEVFVIKLDFERG